MYTPINSNEILSDDKGGGLKELMDLIPPNQNTEQLFDDRLVNKIIVLDVQDTLKLNEVKEKQIKSDLQDKSKRPLSLFERGCEEKAQNQKTLEKKFRSRLPLAEKKKKN
jgi:hypothetical protein